MFISTVSVGASQYPLVVAIQPNAWRQVNFSADQVLAKFDSKIRTNTSNKIYASQRTPSQKRLFDQRPSRT
jgi:hypothetical protein